MGFVVNVNHYKQSNDLFVLKVGNLGRNIIGNCKLIIKRDAWEILNETVVESL